MRKRDIVIYPAILSTSWHEYRFKVKKASKYFSGVQIDVMDGKFVKNRTYSNFQKINTLRPKNLFFEIQLMVQNPLKSILEWSKVADRYIIHIESVQDPLPLLRLVRGMRKGIGLAINPSTSLSMLKPFLKKIDVALVMTVKPGRSGQKFISKTLHKVAALRKTAPRLPIEVDGGINPRNIGKAVQAGATIVISGNYVWGNKNISTAKNNLLKHAF